MICRFHVEVFPMMMSVNKGFLQTNMILKFPHPVLALSYNVNMEVTCPPIILAFYTFATVNPA